METGLDAFDNLIAPLSADDFLGEYWERNFLYLAGERGRFGEYFSLPGIDSWLTSVRTGLPDSVLITAPEGAESKTERYRPEDISLDMAHSAFTRGCSLVFNHMEDWPSLLGLARTLGRYFHADIGVNAYLTPKGARTFPIHTDGHDVFILHLEGEKVWHLHESSLLQIGLPEKKNLRFSEEWYGRTQTAQIAEVCLKPGDLLYVPRGMPHYAVAQNSACFHLTVSVTPLYWMDFLKIAAEQVAVYSEELRRALPPGFVGSGEICERMRRDFGKVMKAFQELTSFDEVVAVVKRNRVAFQGFPVEDGNFAQILACEDLVANSEVERRADVLCVVDDVFDRERNKRVALFFADQRVSGPLHLRRALEFICSNSRFQVSEVPGIDEQGQLVLLRRLIKNGLLRKVA